MEKFLKATSVAALAIGVAVGGLAITSGSAAYAMSSGSGSGGGSAKVTKSVFTQAVEKVKAKDYAAAIPMLKQVVAREPRNADAFNYLGYSYRETGDLQNAMSNYQRALAIDPNHKGANEYLGELYVRLRDLKAAQAQLAKLDKLCSFGCTEYEELKRKVAALRKKEGS